MSISKDLENEKNQGTPQQDKPRDSSYQKTYSSDRYNRAPNARDMNSDQARSGHNSRPYPSRSTEDSTRPSSHRPFRAVDRNSERNTDRKYAPSSDNRSRGNFPERGRYNDRRDSLEPNTRRFSNTVGAKEPRFTSPDRRSERYNPNIQTKAPTLDQTLSVNPAKTKPSQDTAIHGFYGTGRRKNSIAKVRLYPSAAGGKITINGKNYTDFFTRLAYKENILNILRVSDTMDKFNIVCTVLGGGLTGQLGAIQLGIARAMCEYNESYRPVLKVHGMLTRDSRMVLPKRIDHVKSRKRRAYVKR